MEAAESMKQKCLFLPEEIEEIKNASRVAGGSVHPDTNQIIPFYMRLSGFVVFNVPLASLMLFMPG